MSLEYQRFLGVVLPLYDKWHDSAGPPYTHKKWKDEKTVTFV